MNDVGDNFYEYASDVFRVYSSSLINEKYITNSAADVLKQRIFYDVKNPLH